MVPSYDLFASARKEVFSRSNGIQRGHLCFLSWLTIMAQEEDVTRVHPLQVEFKYTVHGKGPRNYDVQPRLVGGGMGEK